jgi:hypothetical protein
VASISQSFRDAFAITWIGTGKTVPKAEVRAGSSNAFNFMAGVFSSSMAVFNQFSAVRLSRFFALEKQKLLTEFLNDYE